MPTPTYFHALALPANPLKRGFTVPRASGRNHYTLHAPGDILSAGVIRRLRDVGAEVKTVALFYKRPGSEGIIHSDVGLHKGRWRRNVAAINWNLSGADSQMRWYKVTGKGVEPELEPEGTPAPWYYTLNGVHFGYYGSTQHENLPDGQVRVLASAAIQGATLVRTDVPHAVQNTDRRRGRWALSLRCEPDFRTWGAAVSTFAPLMMR